MTRLDYRQGSGKRSRKLIAYQAKFEWLHTGKERSNVVHEIG